jgi:hypothetical protein
MARTTALIQKHLISADLARLAMLYVCPHGVTLEEAAELGCYEIAYIRIGTNGDLNYGLLAACRGGHLSIVRLMLRSGATAVHAAIILAIRGGHHRIVNCLLDNSANDWPAILREACIAGHMGLTRRALNRGTRLRRGWDFGYVCEDGHPATVDLLTGYNVSDWNNGLLSACRNGRRDLIDLIITKGANDWNGGLDEAVKGGHPEIAALMVAKGAASEPI